MKTYTAESFKDSPDFESMVAVATDWQSATMAAARRVESDKRLALRISRLTTKGDLDAYLMRTFGIDGATARSVSNTLTQRNVQPDPSTATLEDFAGEPWADKALALWRLGPTGSIRKPVLDASCLDVAIEDGKYRVVMGEQGGLRALRYGEDWRDLTGDGLVYALAAEIKSLRGENASLVSTLTEIEQRILRLHQEGSVINAYGVIFETPALREELVRDDLTAAEMIDRMAERARERQAERDDQSEDSGCHP